MDDREDSDDSDILDPFKQSAIGDDDRMPTEPVIEYSIDNNPFEECVRGDFVNTNPFEESVRGDNGHTNPFEGSVIGDDGQPHIDRTTLSRIDPEPQSQPRIDSKYKSSDIFVDPAKQNIDLKQPVQEKVSAPIAKGNPV